MKESNLQPKTIERKTLSCQSLLVNKEGGHSFYLNQIGKWITKRAFLFDIDKTLVHIEDVYKLIRPKLCPSVNTEGHSIDSIHLDGFQLGTMWHEMIRMKRLNEGDGRFLDMKFTESYFDKGGEGHGIENSEHSLHKEADEELQRFDAVATQACDEVYKHNPKVFEESKIKPVFHLLDLYKRLGIPMVGMSANPRKFIHAVCAYSGLSDYFLACGNDTDTQGMKEYKMSDLIKELNKLDIPIPYDKLYIFGDSPNGDVGSGPRFQKLVQDKHPEVRVKGILICDDEKAYAKGQTKITEPIFRESVEALQLDQVPHNEQGKPKMAGSNRKNFLETIMTFTDKIKQKIWDFIYKFFPSLQRSLLNLGIIWHKGRQKYPIGWLAQGKTLEDLKKHLGKKWNFGNNFVAWIDDGQVLSWRKLVDFRHQYHLRVFEDGEIRGHFEFTPEAHPIRHFKATGEREATKEFLNFLGDFVTQEKKILNLAVDPNAQDPESQITIEHQSKGLIV